MILRGKESSQLDQASRVAGGEENPRAISSAGYGASAVGARDTGCKGSWHAEQLHRRRVLYHLTSPTEVAILGASALSSAISCEGFVHESTSLRLGGCRSARRR